MTSNRILTFTLLAVAALSGCRIQKPSTEVPAAPAITSFTASAETVARGSEVTLTWATTNATEISLREAASGDLSVPVTTVNGSFKATVNADSLFVLVARGAGGTDARAVSVRLDGSGAGVVSFQAIPSVIPGGAGSTLVWTAPNATTVTLAAGAQALSTEGQLRSGALFVTPVRDTTYTLTVDGTAYTAQVTVQPAVLTLEATPRAAEVGDPVVLSWSTAGADRLVVSAAGRGPLVEITDAAQVASGSFTDTVPSLPDNSLVTYEVAAFKGTERFVRTLEVYVGTGLTITRFDAPAVAAAALSYQVRWETLAADAVEVKVDGVSVFKTASAAVVARGQYAFTAPAQDFAVELIATNTRGAKRSQLAQVDAVGVPTGVTLTATPASVTAGQPVTLTWASAEARKVRIVNTDLEGVFSTTGQVAEGGSVVVYPQASTTFTISADNQLGNPPVTATADVTVTGAPLVLNQFPPTPLTGQMVSVTTSQPGALFTGFPHSQILESSQADFIDISGTGTRVLESADVTTVSLPFTTWLWGERVTGSLTVSRAGWMAWGAPATVQSTEYTLPSTSAPAGVIAPYWDNLTMVAGSGVYVQLVGEAPEQQLVVQWDKVQSGTTAGTQLTFQVRVHQTGSVSFHYKTMNLTGVTSPTFTIGVQNPARTLAVSRTFTAPASNTAKYFFSPVAERLDLRVLRGGSYGGYVTLGNSRVRVTRSSGAVAIPTDLALSELMFRPSLSVANGEYMEFLNRTAAPLDLTGWVIRSGTTSFEAPTGFSLPSQVPFVLGASTDPALNDDAGVALAWGSLQLNRDAGSFSIGTADGSVAFTYSGPSDGGVGVSVEVDPGPLVGTTGSPGPVACAPTTTFGSQSPLQLGSPGALGSCFPYRMASIAPRFVDISDAGTVIPGGDAVITTVVLSNDGGIAPRYFGNVVNSISVSSNGFLTMGPSSSASDSNPTTMSTSSANTVAPFWDDLDEGTNSGIYWKFFDVNEDPATPAAHWVIQWAHYSSYFSTPFDDLNFEVMLFTDGTVEFHYATMAGTYSNYASGGSATVWIGNAGTLALAINLNTTLVAPMQSNVAYRFSPR